MASFIGRKWQCKRDDSLTRCGSCFAGRKRSHLVWEGAERKIRFLCLLAIYVFAFDLPMTLSSLPTHPSRVFPLFTLALQPWEISLALLLSLRTVLNIPLCFLHNFRLHAPEVTLHPGMYSEKGELERGCNSWQEELRNILERRRPCSSREFLSRAVSDKKIRIINAERACEVR